MVQYIWLVPDVIEVHSERLDKQEHVSSAETTPASKQLRISDREKLGCEYSPSSSLGTFKILPTPVTMWYRLLKEAVQPHADLTVIHNVFVVHTYAGLISLCTDTT